MPAEEGTTPKKESKERPRKARFHFLKSTYYRQIHVDGAFGGVTPRGFISLTVYAERFPVPQLTVHELTEEGTLGEESTDERISRDGAIREVEVTMYMDWRTAESLHQWLGEKVEQRKKFKAE